MYDVVTLLADCADNTACVKCWDMKTLAFIII